MFFITLLINWLYCSVGADADEERIELLLSQVKGKDITELIAAGREKLASVPAGGGAVACAAPVGGGGAAAAPAAAAESKKEEKVEEKEESDDVSLQIFLVMSQESSYACIIFMLSIFYLWPNLFTIFCCRTWASVSLIKKLLQVVLLCMDDTLAASWSSFYCSRKFLFYDLGSCFSWIFGIFIG